MTITLVGAGSVAYSALNGSSVSPSYPTGPILAGDLLLLWCGRKPSSAGAGSTTLSGWNNLGGGFAGGYGSTLGADTGNTELRCFSNLATGGESGSVAVSLTSNNIAWSQIVCFRATGTHETWSVVDLAFGAQLADGHIAVTMLSSRDWQPGDRACWGWCCPTDVNAGSQYTAHQISASGIGFGTAGELGEAASSTGNDVGGFTAHAAVLSGSATVAETISAIVGNTSNMRGLLSVVRMRTSTPPARAGDFFPFIH